MNKPDIIVGVTQNSLRPTVPPDCPALYSQLMTDCWADDPSKRPSFAEVLHRLEAMHQTAEAKGREGSIVLPTPMNLTERFRSVGKDSTSQNWEIDPTELEFMEEMYEGPSARTYKGKFRGNQVAIKVLKENPDGKHKEDFKKEVEVMRFDNYLSTFF